MHYYSIKIRNKVFGSLMLVGCHRWCCNLYMLARRCGDSLQFREEQVECLSIVSWWVLTRTKELDQCMRYHSNDDTVKCEPSRQFEMSSRSTVRLHFRSKTVENQINNCIKRRSNWRRMEWPIDAFHFISENLSIPKWHSAFYSSAQHVFSTNRNSKHV